MSQVMELSKEVHGLLDRIKRLSNAQNINVNHDATYDSINRTYCTLDEPEVEFSNEELIPLENFDVSNRETWLYVSETSDVSSMSDINDIPNNSLNMSSDSEKYNRKFDTRTFTRPKKRMVRPKLGDMSDCDSDKSTSKITDLESLKIPENPFNISTKNDVGISTGPLHFKLSDPVMNHSFDKILMTSSDRYDSFQNMSPPSLMNSLCSSTFNTLIDSSSKNVPNETVVTVPETNDSMENILSPPPNFDSHSDSNRMESSCTSSIISTEKINKLLSPEISADLNLTFTPTNRRLQPPSNRTFEKNNDHTTLGKSVNTTISKNIYQTYNKSKLNSTYRTSSCEKLNATNQNKMNTFTKKPRNITNIPDALKKSCPDINRTYQPISYEKTLNRTIQKLSDSQPNLTKDIQQTILNQSFELMSTNVYEGYRSNRLGSTDSLDDKSSSLSSSSKDSGPKPLNTGDLDNLARLQEQSLQQIMSTPKPKGVVSKFWDSEQISPIHKQEEYLSEDSDVSDICLTARSRVSLQSSSTLSSRSGSQTQINVPVSAPASKTNINRLLPPQSRAKEERENVRNVPTMIVKPMEPMNDVPQQIMQPAGLVRPRVRSGLPRPTAVSSTGIPRPASRIPAPRFSRPPMVRPLSRPTKTEWNDGCY